MLSLKWFSDIKWGDQFILSNWISESGGQANNLAHTHFRICAIWMLFKAMKLNKISRKINGDTEKTDHQTMSPGGEKETWRKEWESNTQWNRPVSRCWVVRDEEGFREQRHQYRNTFHKSAAILSFNLHFFFFKCWVAFSKSVADSEAISSIIEKTNPALWSVNGCNEMIITYYFHLSWGVWC